VKSKFSIESLSLKLNATVKIVIKREQDMKNKNERKK
jgi:hypothetical protein